MYTIRVNPITIPFHGSFKKGDLISAVQKNSKKNPTGGFFFAIAQVDRSEHEVTYCTKQHLYLYSDEQPNDEDWIVKMLYTGVHGEVRKYNEVKDYDSTLFIVKKIEATTDKSLNLPGISKDLLKTFVLMNGQIASFDLVQNEKGHSELLNKYDRECSPEIWVIDGPGKGVFVNEDNEVVVKDTITNKEEEQKGQINKYLEDQINTNPVSFLLTNALLHCTDEQKVSLAYNLLERCIEAKETDAEAFSEWVDHNCIRAGEHEFKCTLDNYTESHTTKKIYELWKLNITQGK